MTEKTTRPTKRTGAETAFDKEPLPDKIGKSLRQMYDDVIKEDIPDDFLNLLKQADEKHPGKRSEPSK